MGSPLDLIGTQDEIEAITRLAKGFDGVEAVSEPSMLDASKALNAGLTPDMIQTALTLVTLVFTTGSAALKFLKELRAELQAHATVTVSDSPTGKALGRVEVTTSDQALEKLLPK
jgi:hypothetical protein